MSITYNTIPPPEHLASYVRFFWTLESDAPYTHRHMADISPELIFHYQGRFDKLTTDGRRTPSFRSGVHGQSSKISRFTIDKSFGIFGAYLYPYAIPLLFGLNASELTNQTPELEALWNPGGRELEEKMILARDNRQRMQIITGFLSGIIHSIPDNYPTIFSSVKYIMETRGKARVEDIADKYCLSERQLERKFKQFTGFTPKLFSRITRFHASLKKYEKKDHSLTQIALDCGYYDQSHFIQDFKEFSGYLPSEFFSGKAEGTEWREG